MAKGKKVRAVYTVFEYEGDHPMEAILPDGRMAVLVLPHDMYPCSGASISNGVFARRRGGKVTFEHDCCETIEEAREMIAQNYDEGVARRLKLEIRPIVSFD